MRAITFDLNLLRSFVTGVELGSFSKASERLGRSTSAISNQLKKLEEQAGTPILRKSGRGLVLTEAGETLLAYARRLLDLNEEAVSAVQGVELEGKVRLGLQQDFGETLLSQVLGRFARAHPKVRIEACVGRNAELIERVTTERLDLALAWDNGVQNITKERVAELPMRWIGQSTKYDTDFQNDDEPVPLALIEAPCLFRDAAMESLDRAGIAWRVAFTSPNLGGLWAAVAAGLGVTIRTQFELPPGVQAMELKNGKLPPKQRSISLALLSANTQSTPLVTRLGEIVQDAVLERISSSI